MAKNFKEKKINRQVFILLIVLILAVFLRFYELNLVPPSLFIDEVDLGYQAYSILKTGRDYFGNFLPIHFHSLADWRTPLYLYAAVPSIALFGLNEWGVRLPSAILGIISVLLIYLLTQKLFRKDSLLTPHFSLLASLLLAVNPWHLHYSRAGFEVTMMLTIFLAALYTFILGLKKEKFLLLSAFLFGLTPYVYSTAKFYTPLFLLCLVLIYKEELKKIKKKYLFISILTLLVVGSPMAKEIIFGQGGMRFQILSIFTDSNSIGPALHARYLATMTFQEPLLFGIHPATLAVIFYNQLTVWFQTFLNNYLVAFSPQFLFLNGDPNWRHSISGFGMFYWLESISILVGFIWLLSSKLNKKIKQLLFSWLFLSPIPAAITRDGAGHATRLFFLLPVLVLLSTLGFWQIFLRFNKVKLGRALLVLLLAFFTFNFAFFLYTYRFVYPVESAREWHYGYKELFTSLGELEDDYQKVVLAIESEPVLPFYAFFEQNDPTQFQKRKFEEKIINDLISTQHLIDTQYYFGAFNPKLSLGKKVSLTDAIDQKTLYVARPVGDLSKKIPKGLKLIETINYPTNEPAFYLITHE